jgi:hypothetical protein
MMGGILLNAQIVTVQGRLAERFMKACSKCNVIKPLDDFHTLKKGKNGRHPKCKSCRSVQESERYRKNGIPRRKTHAQWLKWKYGLSIEQYRALILKQYGCCAVCDKQSELVVDHCHLTGVVRGLLCPTCNQGLGKLGDTVGSLKCVLKYLEGWQS